MAKVHDFRAVGGADELVSEAYAQDWPVYLSDQVHLRLEDHSSVGFGQHEVGAGKNYDTRIPPKNGIVHMSGIVVQYLGLLTCTQRDVVKRLFRFFGFLVVVDD